MAMWNIQGGRNDRLWAAMKAMDRAKIDVGILTETNIYGGIKMT